MYSKITLMALGLVAACISTPAMAAPVADPMTRPAIAVREPGKAYLTSVTRAGKRLVAVGEHGIIVLSDDDGKAWQQAKAPTSATLTAVQFPSPRQGWATGHYGIVLHSEDGGETWTRQLDGVQAAQLVLRDAETANGGADNARYLADARRLVQDGPDKPLLGLYFTDERNGFVVGAYNLALRTADGGETWTPFMRQLDNSKGNHLYAVCAAGDTVYVAGEQGLVLRSHDAGRTFERADTGYKGSFFAVGVLGNGEVVVAGLRGSAFRSADGGRNWEQLASPASVSITALAPRGRDELVLANQAGQLLLSVAGSKALVPLKVPTLPPLNDVVVDPDGGVVVASMFGAMRVPVVATSLDSQAAK